MNSFKIKQEVKEEYKLSIFDSLYQNLIRDSSIRKSFFERNYRFRL